MGRYANEARRLLELIGGKENIAAVTHCMTRMRFALADMSRADIKAIEEMEIVKGSFTQAGQFQVIIGTTVKEFYEDFVAVSGMEGASKEEVRQQAKSNMNCLQRIIGGLAEIFAPLIPAIIVGGLILGFRNIIDSIYLFENGTKTLVQISQFWAGVDSFLWLPGEAIFHFLPVGVVWSVTKKFGGTEILGIVTGITLVSPQLLNAYSVATTAAGDIPMWDFGFTQIDMIGYQAQIIPVLLVGFTLVFLERLFRKITPDMIQMIIVPLFAVIPTVILAHTVLGPIGWAIGNAITSFVQAGFTSSLSWLFGGIYGFFYCILVITGLHHTILAVDLQLIADVGGTYIWPIHALCGMAQATAVLGYLYLKRKQKGEMQIGIPAAISASLGVSEPAIFGINLKYFYPFLAALIGSGIGGMISIAFGCMANSIGVSGVPAFLSMQTKTIGGYAIAAVTTILTTFVLTIAFSKTKLAKKKK
ncbi:MAG: PTS system trehalose-specific EIIBC component [Faecalimonas umbilicata]|uniref:PTS system trehalose-specific EIIBC component n=1 Tax=Faecalimonas umbilicata TaxID=1912855 RepID=UPI002431F3D7|nr:PTS system trehalose-specific EIIBC component [Faecalimonas umbilicata]MCI5986172.1 PTS system trehalose-specific EIIBC component [Faecalimonas umbilicata]MDY5092273.1 PTS system trehalose-specific EIIBC component [Faecalimonas umbilicata]